MIDKIYLIFSEAISFIVWNRKVFIGFWALILVSAIGLLVYGEWCSPKPIEKSPSLEEILVYPLDRGTVDFPLELNVVAGDFTEKDYIYLHNVTVKWAEETKGLVRIQINKNWNPPELFSESYYRSFGKKTLWKRSGAQENEVLKLQLKYSICADAVSVGDFIMVIDDFHNMPSEKLYVIILHELGHQLGLEHIKPKYPALMNVGGNDGGFTRFDALALCSLFNCK